MAVPRNQVAISSFADPYGGLAKTFSDLSKTYAEKGSREAALALRERAATESARRFGIEQQTALDKATVGNKRWEITQAAQEAARLETAGQRKIINDRNQRIENKEDALNRALANSADGTREYTQEAYPQNAQNAQNSKLNLFAEQRDLTRGYLTSGEENLEVLNQIKNNIRLRHGDKENISSSDKNKLTNNRLLKFTALRDELLTLNPEDKQTRIDSFLNNQYTIPIEEIHASIRKGTGLSVQDRIKFNLSNIPEKDNLIIDRVKLRQGLEGSVGGMTDAQLRENEEERVTLEREKEQSRIDNTLKWFNATKDNRMDNTSPAAYSSATKILKAGLGDSASTHTAAFYSALGKEGVPPVYAANATVGTSTPTWGGLSTGFPKAGTPEFGKAVAAVKKGYDTVKAASEKNNGERVTKDNLVTKVIPGDKRFTERSTGQIRASLFTMPQVNDIQVQAKFVDKLLASRDVAKAVAEAAAAAEAEAEAKADAEAAKLKEDPKIVENVGVPTSLPDQFPEDSAPGGLANLAETLENLKAERGKMAREMMAALRYSPNSSRRVSGSRSNTRDVLRSPQITAIDDKIRAIERRESSVNFNNRLKLPKPRATK